jgi:hypothetical protein
MGVALAVRQKANCTGSRVADPARRDMTPLCRPTRRMQSKTKDLSEEF